MSLLRLLAAGKSLAGLKPANVRYRLSNERLLPKFGSKTNPFRPDTVQECSMPLQPQLASAESNPNPSQPAEANTAKDHATNPSPGKVNLAPTPERPKPASWAGRLAAVFRTRPSRLKSAIPAFVKPMVQVELSLERVKVVRNDLSDSDLDIVRCRSEATSTKRSSPGQGPNHDLTNHSSEQAVAQLFGAGAGNS
jgi:hypothetical protein